MSRTRCTVALAALFFVAAATAARADGFDDSSKNLRGLYAGVGAGVGVHDSPSSTEDAWRLQVWWRVNRYISMEMGYLDTGDPHQVADVDGLHLVAVPSIPIAGGFELFAKGGGFFFEDTAWAWGAGATYHLPKDFGLRFDWDRIEANDGDDPIDVVTLSVFYHFLR